MLYLVSYSIIVLEQGLHWFPNRHTRVDIVGISGPHRQSMFFATNARDKSTHVLMSIKAFADNTEYLHNMMGLWIK